MSTVSLCCFLRGLGGLVLAVVSLIDSLKGSDRIFARELATGWLWNSFLEQYAPISIQAHGKRYILSDTI
jgi:hypothetical protein